MNILLALKNRLCALENSLREVQVLVSQLIEENSVVQVEYTPSFAADPSQGKIFDMTMEGPTEIANPLTAENGKTIIWWLRQNGTGGITPTLGSKFRLPRRATLPLEWWTAPNQKNEFSATYDATDDMWDATFLNDYPPA